jgi:NAD(P)-dependent dehydrogenase (short-subunit alcohol dehydrogenase family)
MADDMKGGTALVTGSGSGMGRELARILARRGVQVAVADLRLDAAKATVDMIAGEGGNGRAYALDVSDSGQVNALVAAVEKELGPIKYLAQLAGIHDFRAIEDISDELWDRMMRVNVYGQFYVCRAVLPRMCERRFGVIVNMSSIHAVRGESKGAHYAAAKSAITGFTKSIAREKAEFNIRANSVAPGPIDTPLWRGDRSDAENEVLMKNRSRVIPVGRLGRADEVAEVMAFLLSPQSSYMNGQTLNIDGGEIMN